MSSRRQRSSGRFATFPRHLNPSLARWSTQGAEAVLKLRAIRANNDFEPYWRYHLKRERQRVHETRYNNSVTPLTA